MSTNVINLPLCQGLKLARIAADELAAQGITVYTAEVSKGPEAPVLHVSTLPAGIPFGLRMRYPDARGGTVLVHAAFFEGCRLEWSVVRPARSAKGASHG